MVSEVDGTGESGCADAAFSACGQSSCAARGSVDWRVYEPFDCGFLFGFGLDDVEARSESGEWLWKLKTKSASCHQVRKSTPSSGEHLRRAFFAHKQRWQGLYKWEQHPPTMGILLSQFQYRIPVTLPVLTSRTEGPALAGTARLRPTPVVPGQRAGFLVTSTSTNTVSGTVTYTISASTADPNVTWTTQRKTGTVQFTP